jgi:hypothetical protein
MSASQTTVPLVEATLLELFKAAVEASTEVWACRPNEDHQLEENVYIGSVAGRRQFKLIGATVQPNSRQEEYTITVEVEVYRQGSDGPGTQARMWEIAQQLELAVAENRGLQSTGSVKWGISADFRQSTVAAPDGFLSSYVFGVAVTARV